MDERRPVEFRPVEFKGIWVNYVLAKLTVIIGFIVAFGAGLAVGTRALSDRPGPHGPGPGPATHQNGGPGGPGGWMTAELKLSPEQQEQLKKIWEQPGLRGGRGRESDDKRKEFRKQRDEAIAGLIRPEDKAKFDQANKLYNDQTTALETEMRAGFQKAVEQTKQILTPDQREKYEVLLKRFDSERGPRDHGRPPRDRGTTQPATKP